MELQNLYLLKDCLEHVASVGTDALADDPSLETALHAFSPHAMRDPALGQIRHALRELLSAAPDDRPARLLHALDLVLAAIRERAEAELPGELTPSEPGGSGYARAPYSRLRPLIDALSGSGSGRISVIEEAWANNPDCFADSRILPCLALAPGGAYGELEELLGVILTAQGKRVVPYLKDGFSPVAAREMEKRVYWVARLGGAEENDWFRAVLPETRKELREAVIAALGVSQDNAALLRELYRGESGKCRDAALRALSRMDDGESRALWTEALEAHPDCPPCLEGVNAPLAADMSARVLRGAFSEALARERRELTRAELLTLLHATLAFCGKYSADVRETWLWCASQIDALAEIRPDRSVRQWDLSAAEMLEKCLMETVLWNPCAEVRALAEELAALAPAHFLGAAALSALLLRPAEAFDRYGAYIVKNGFLRKENAVERANRIQLMRALAAVQYDEKDGFRIPFSRKDALTGAAAAVCYRIDAPDPRWAETLGDAKVNRDGAVFDLKNAESMEKRVFSLEQIAPPQPPVDDGGTPKQ